MIDFEFEFHYAEGKTPALREVKGSVEQGTCVVLCGGSGCGKSTLLRCINGLIPQFYEGEWKGFCYLNGKILTVSVSEKSASWQHPFSRIPGASSSP